ncbi:VIR protein [Plasmodium vivax]|uniref:VIR protein n=1 Tax=Plasmodium vivax TaxID=5855 RepID=A0A1G4E555_PLAVI|nr:VIR protein [Plasmodium vivax]
MEEFLGKSKLANLNTIINYDYFDREEGICANYPHITAAKSKLAGFRWKNDVSDKILNALCYVYRRKVNNMSYINSCNYLYYWLGSKILTNLLLPHFLFEVVNTSYRILNESELGEICHPFNYRINEYNFFKFKDVYDLSEDYNTYESHFIKPYPSCDRDYQDELKSYVFLFKELLNECTLKRTYNNDQYCNLFNEYFTKARRLELYSWKCELKESEEHVYQLEKEPRDDARNEQMPERPDIIVEQRNNLQRLLGSGLFAEHPSTLDDGLLAENKAMSGASDHSENSSPSTIKKSITSAVSAAGVLVPPFIIYNYAPARSWINKLLGMNKGTNRNPYANQELMADFSMPEDFYSERNRYNIMYNPE